MYLELALTLNTWRKLNIFYEKKNVFDVNLIKNAKIMVKVLFFVDDDLDLMAIKNS